MSKSGFPFHSTHDAHFEVESIQAISCTMGLLTETNYRIIRRKNVHVP